MTHYDVVVIGAGQGGGPLAGAFARAGRRTALIERAHIGGTCVNEGCSPTKTMVASARAAYIARRGAEYGVHTAPLAIDLRRVRERKRDIVDSFRTASERGLDRAGVAIVRGQARFSGARQLEITTADGVEHISADLIFISTGQRPTVPGIPGLADTPYLTSTSIMELGDVPEHLVVLGGGYVGLEFAQMFRRFGSRVTIVQRDDQLLPREDEDVAEAVHGILSDDGIEVVLGADATEIRYEANEFTIHHRPRGESAGVGTSVPSEGGSVTGTHLLVAVGRTPNTNDLNLNAGGVDVNRQGYVTVNDRLETSAVGVYAMGDVTGGPAFTHIAYDDYRLLRTNLLGGGGATTNNRLVPYTVFIDPQLGRIGMTEREARDRQRSIRVGVLPMSRVARALEVDETRGFMKAVVDADSGCILGAAVLGIEGGEIATLLQVAMMGGVRYTALRDGVFSHPTIAEALNNLFTEMDRASG